MAEVAKRNRVRIPRGGGNGVQSDVIQLKSGGARMTVSKLFKSPEGLGSRGRGITAHQARRTRLTDLAARRTCERFVLPERFQHDHLSMGLVSRKGCDDEIRSRPIAAIHYDSFWNRRSMKHM